MYVCFFNGYIAVATGGFKASGGWFSQGTVPNKIANMLQAKQNPHSSKQKKHLILFPNYELYNHIL